MLGRLVRLETPDGVHALAFDGFGRPARIDREGLGAISYTYDATTGLLARKQRLDSEGAVSHTSETAYDELGRITHVEQTATGSSTSIDLEYDGQIDDSTLPGQLGHPTRVRGDGWERVTVFDALDRPVSQHVDLTGWRRAATEREFRADGSVSRETVTVTDDNGAVRFASTKENTLDNLGRLSEVYVDGERLYLLLYDDEGRLSSINFDAAQAIRVDYDPVTHQRTGYYVEAQPSMGASTGFAILAV